MCSSDLVVPSMGAAYSLILHLSTLGEACVAIYSSGVFLLRGRVLGRMGEAVKWKASRIWLARKRPDEDKYGVYNRRCRPWWDETNAGILPAPASKLAGDPVRCAQDDNFEGSVAKDKCGDSSLRSG